MTSTFNHGASRTLSRSLAAADEFEAQRFDFASVAIIVVTAIIFAHVYTVFPGTPSGPGVSGWEGWWDQSNYIKSARALARGDFAAENHWYQIGYSMLGAPFAYIGMRDPFVAVNLISLIAFVLLFIRLFSPVIGRPAAACALAIGLLLPTRITVPHVTDWVVASQFVIPWNTNPIAPLYLGILLIMRRLPADERFHKDVVLGLLVGAVAALRLADVVALVPVGLAYTFLRLRAAEPVKHVAIAVTGALLVFVPFVVLTWKIHVGLGSAYVDQAALIGVSFSDLHERFMVVFIDSSTVFDTDGLSIRSLQPWLMLLAPFAIFWAVADGRSGRLVVAVMAMSVAFYLAFNDFWPLNILQYYLIHYIAWIFPMIVAAGFAGAVVSVRQRRWRSLAACLIGALALTQVSYTVRPIDAEIGIAQDPESATTTYTVELDRQREIDAVDLLGAAAAEGLDITLQTAVITAGEGEPLDLFKGYRLIQTRSGVRIIFNKHIRTKTLVIAVTDTLDGAPSDGDAIVVLRKAIGF